MSGPALKSAGYQEALSFLYGRIDYERTAAVPGRWKGLNLERMRRLLEMLGNPQRQVRVVHLAGTKGKGSTAMMVSEILREAGYRVGLYTSPHLNRLEERFVVDGTPCCEHDIEELVDSIRPAVAKLDAAGEDNGATFFEITTALAWLHFAKRSVDFAVLEVGMGGRLDSTNVCEPLISVITSISFDHTRQLGNTLAAIAKEKAGIIKPGVPVVSGVRQTEPREMIRGIAASRGCQLFELGADFDYEWHEQRATLAHASDVQFSYEENAGPRHDEIHLPLAGGHQVINATLAVAVCHRLTESGYPVPPDAIRRGLAQVRLPARVEFVSHSPCIVVDTAHNVASVEALVEVIEQVEGVRNRTLVFAATRDKDVAGMLDRLLPHFHTVVITRYRNNPRAVEPAELATLAQSRMKALDRFIPMEIADDPVSAWDEIYESADAADLICITGSFFLAAELRDRCQQVAFGNLNRQS